MKQFGNLVAPAQAGSLLLKRQGLGGRVGHAGHVATRAKSVTCACQHNGADLPVVFCVKQGLRELVVQFGAECVATLWAIHDKRQDALVHRPE